MQQAILNEELARARAPQLLNRVGINNAGPTLIAHGDEALKRRLLPPILTGDEVWCQLFSEPNAGSDLAAVRTRAELDGDDFRVTRTEGVDELRAVRALGASCSPAPIPTQPKHRGLTYFILDMQSAGITIRPLRQITGSTEFSEVFLDAVRVPRAHVIGGVNRGWEIAMHHARPRARHRLRVQGAGAAADRARGADGAGARARARRAIRGVRQEVARGWIDVEVMRLMNCRTLTRLERGEEPGPESSLVKLFWAHLTQRLHELALELRGPEAQLAAVARVDGGRWQQAFLWSRVGAIAGGTSEVQANIIAQRILGLPR